MSPTTPSRAGRGPALALALVLALWLAATAGWRALALPDEGRYVGIAWEMLHAGEASVPTLAGQPFFHKPPLFYWITAAALSLGGLHPIVARAASWLAALAAALALYGFARRWGGTERARAAVLVLATLPLFYGASQYANLDMLVAACIAIAILAFADAVLRSASGQDARMSIVAGHAAAALGVLAKGLIGVVLPLLVIGAWTLLRERRRAPRTWLKLLWWPGPLLFALIALPWFLLMQQRFPGFFDYFFVVQHLQRFAGGGFNNAHPFWFYAAVVPLLCLPWTPWAWRWRQRAFWADPAQRDVRLLMAVWALVVVLFFSWPQSKLVGYVLPACPPLAYLLADAVLASATTQRNLWATGVVAAALCVVLIGVIAQRQPEGSAAMAVVLKRERAPGEPLVFIDHYPFDLPMLSGFDDALVAIDDWHGAAVQASDDWRRELADAERFASKPVAARLVDRRDLGARLCGARAAWVVAPKSSLPAPLVGLQARAGSDKAALWRLEGPALDRLRPDCPRTPNDAPTGK